MDDFEIELKRGFLDEASQLLADAEQCFLGLEADPNDQALIEKIFRLAHNLKGSSKAVGFDQLGSFTHEFESFFLKIKNKQIVTSPEAISLLLRCNDQIKNMVDELKHDLSKQFDLQSLIAELHSVAAGEVQVLPEKAVEPEMASAPDELAVPEASAFSEEPELVEESPTIEEIALISSVTQEGLPEMLEDLTTSHIPAPVPAVSVLPDPVVVENAPAKKVVSAVSEESIRVSLSRLEKLINFVGEMSILQTVLQEQVFGSNTALIRKTTLQLGKVCKEVQDISMSLRMVPVKQTFQKMQRIVRDTSSALNKKVQLVLEGEETELDKTVLEAIGDPLVHLIRNAVDHGVENGADRIAVGKPEMGTVWLRAFHQSGKLVIEVKDDGGGINGKKLTAKAIEKGILKLGTELPEKEAVKLIFHPGFSTKAQVSEVSGRGVGMDVVKTNIEQLQGEVTIETEVGKGTTLRIELPLTLAIIDGMVIQDGEERFVIPLSQVYESVKPAEGELHHRTGVGDVLQLRGEVITTFRLSSLIYKNGGHSKRQPKDQIAMIFRLGESPFAILVDDILRQQQVVVKQLGPELKNIKGYSGSAILGDGKPALILEMQDLTANQKMIKNSPSKNSERGVA